MDVHKDAIAVAYVAQEHGAAVNYLGTLGTRQCDIDQLIRKRPSTATPLSLISEAGPCGSWLSRYLTTKGYDCWVGAPALMPTKPGERVKTDRREAMPLARLARAGDLTAVYVPQGEEAAMRALTRARADTISDLPDATYRLNACVLRHAIRYVGRAHWGPAPLRWLSHVVWPTPAQPMVLQAYLRAVSAHHARLQRLDQALREHVKAWRVFPVVEALSRRGGVSH